MELFEVTSDDDAELSIAVRGYGPQDAMHRARVIYCLVGVLHARLIDPFEIKPYTAGPRLILS